jgi:hydroxymethylpyrimidine/phosphomethylpyrimidine kinase
MLCTELLPLAHVVTPNVPEAEALSGKRIESGEDLKDAARRIHDMGAAAVLITGGHRPQRLEHRSPEVVDVLFDGHHFLNSTARIDNQGPMERAVLRCGGRRVSCAWPPAR